MLLFKKTGKHKGRGKTQEVIKVEKQALNKQDIKDQDKYHKQNRVKIITSNLKLLLAWNIRGKNRAVWMLVAVWEGSLK